MYFILFYVQNKITPGVFVTPLNVIIGLKFCISAPNLIFPLDNVDSDGAWMVKRASSVPGYHGQALQINGPNQYIEMTLDEKNRCLQNPDLCVAGVTISFWVMDLGNANGFFPILYSDGCGGGKLGFCFGLKREMFWVIIRGRSREYRNRIPPLEINEWHHVTFTFIVDGIITLYMDGCDSAPYRLHGYELVTAISGSATAISKYLRFGSKDDAALVNLDHVLIWYDVLSAGEIWKLYLQGGTV